MADLYPNLPSLNVKLKDGGLVITPPPATTKSTLLVGFGADGPEGEPYAINNISESQATYGRKSDLSLAIGQTYNAGCRDVRALRLLGKVAELTLKDNATTPVNLITLKGYYSGALYNEAKATVGASSITIKKPNAKGGQSLVFNLKKEDNVTYKTLDEVIAEINAHAKNNVIIASLAEGATGTASSNSLGALAETALTGGADKPTNIEEVLKAALQVAENYYVDQVVLVGMYADNATDRNAENEVINYAQILANHCYGVSEKFHQTIGFISVTPLANTRLTDINAAVEALVARDNVYYLKETGEDNVDYNVLDELGNAISIGHMISVVALPEFLFVDPVAGRYYAPGAAAYAGLVSNLKVKSAPTNKPISGAMGLRYLLSLPQLDKLAGAGYVAFRDRAPSFVVADAPTAAVAGSDFKRLSTLRTAFEAIQVVRDAADPFLGEPNESPEHNALITAIRSGLSGMQKDGTIKAFSFSLTAPAPIAVLGEANVELDIVPAMELRKIRATVTLRPQLEAEEV